MNEITNDTISFPNLVVDTLTPWLGANIDGISEDLVFNRDLRGDDPSGCLGLVWLDWIPLDSEIGQWQPSLGRYTFVLQVMTRDSDEAMARRLHGNISKSVRDGLYRNAELRVSLGQLAISDDGDVERFTRLDVVSQTSGSIEEFGNYIYVSVLQFTIDAEVIHT